LAEVPPVNVRQRRAAATRQQLLTAACGVFEEEGYTAASVGAITERADTAHGTFYLYFRNKEDAFCQVMEAAVLDELATTVSVPEGTPPDEVLEPVVRGFVEAYRANWRLWRAALQAALVSKRVQDLWLNLRGVFLQRMVAVLEAERARGACRALDPVSSACALMAMIEGFAFVHFGLHGPLQPGSETAAAGYPAGYLVDHPVDHAVGVLTDLWRHAVYGRLPV
jgi:AcrR family transcriptional regulator